MIVAIADTHAAIWYLFSDPRLGKAASAFIDDTVAKGNHIGVSATRLAEIAITRQLRGIPVLSRDGRLRSSAIITIW
jgi:PIN domain nuclease of toxin-antitoxin system